MIRRFATPLLIAVCAGAAVALSACPPAEGEGEGEGEGEWIDNPYGFQLRVPGSHDIDGDTARDVEFMCTLSIDGHDAVVYLRATPTGIAAGGMFPLPVYDDVQAFVLEGDVITEATATYDYGGNHNNDYFSVTLGDVRYTWDHSSYGYGFRACQPPDCLKREQGLDFTDGCQPDRTLAEACIEVTNPLPALVDNFQLCAGDPG